MARVEREMFQITYLRESHAVWGKTLYLMVTHISASTLANLLTKVHSEQVFLVRTFTSLEVMAECQLVAACFISCERCPVQMTSKRFTSLPQYR